MTSLLNVGLHGMQHMVLLKIVSVRDEVLRTEAEELPLTVPVDEMVGRANVCLPPLFSSNSHRM